MSSGDQHTSNKKTGLDFDSFLTEEAPVTFSLWEREWKISPIGHRKIGSLPMERVLGLRRTISIGTVRAALLKKQLNELAFTTEDVTTDELAFTTDEDVMADVERIVAEMQTVDSQFLADLDEIIGIVVDDPTEWATRSEANGGIPAGICGALWLAAQQGMDGTRRPFTSS